MKIYKCFIASPSDVFQERETCDTVFEEINKTIGESQGFRIETVKWENDATPGFSSDAQAIINEQLTPGEHDFFIGILWTRFGQPTKRSESGTLEEFNLAYDNWCKKGKPEIQIYFNNAQISPSEIIPDDIAKIKDFQKKVAEKGGLYAKYSGIADFAKQLRTNITKSVLQLNVGQSSVESHIATILDRKLNDALRMFNGQPVCWIDRLLCKPEDVSESFSKCVEKSVSISAILDTSESCIIKAPPQFGLTCLAHKIRKEAWDKKHQAYMYIDLNDFKVRKFSQAFESEQLFFENRDISCIIIDSWSAHKDSLQKLLESINCICPGIRLIIFQTEINSLDILYSSPLQSDREFLVYNLLPLPKTDIRTVVRQYTPLLKFDEDTVLNKLISDMEVLNMHRTPMNCWTLLKVAENCFDKNPVNRTQILELVLFAVFNFAELPTYATVPDAQDCEHVLGFFCEKLLRNNDLAFAKNQFFETNRDFCKSKLLDINIDALWNILLDNKIVIESANDVFRFKSSFWVYFFAAKRMDNDIDFKEYIFSEKRYSHYPEIIEFYTGITRNKTDVLLKLFDDLQSTRATMVEKLGLPPEGINPLKMLKWTPKDSDIEKMKNKLSHDVVQSAIPKHIKDQHADRTYNHLTPYNQDLHKFLEESSFLVFVYQLRALSRALRNSDYASVTVRVKIFAEIISAWGDIAKVLFVLSPILAQYGRASFGGMGFYLDHSFNDYHDEALFLAIIQAAPYNVLNLVKDDIASDRIEPLVSDYLQKNPCEIFCHFIALYLIRQRSTHWQEKIKNIIAKLDKNSFYLGDLYHTLSYYYQYDYLTKNDEIAIKNLIKTCIIKHEFAIPSPSIANIAKVSDDVLPIRDDEKLRKL